MFFTSRKITPLISLFLKLIATRWSIGIGRDLAPACAETSVLQNEKIEECIYHLGGNLSCNHGNIVDVWRYVG
jgi:hypothetical protein